MTIICMHCKQALDPPAKGQKQPIGEDRAQSPGGISHGLCPECLEKYYPLNKR